jgi:16S rRNA G966 N2-methylase RsmD
VVFVERAPAGLAALRGNLDRLGLTAGFRIQSGSVGAWLRKASGGGATFDLVFLDPPYEAADEYAATLGMLGGDAAGLLAEGALVIAEHRSKAGREERLEERYGKLDRMRLLEQGDAALSFYKLMEP